MKGGYKSLQKRNWSYETLEREVRANVVYRSCCRIGMEKVTCVPASSPVVFDDPITSMDYRHIHEVCDRIIALAEDHQIIVFTHNIWFAAELLGKADKKKWKYYDLRLEGGDAGVVTAATHPRVDTIAQVSARVRR